MFKKITPIIFTMGLILNPHISFAAENGNVSASKSVKITQDNKATNNVHHAIINTAVHLLPKGSNPLIATAEELQPDGVSLRSTNLAMLKNGKDAASWNKRVVATVQSAHIISSYSATQRGWSGVVDHKTSSRVVGTWIQPYVNSYGRHSTFSCQWIGLGGYGTQPLIQIGTNSFHYPDGTKYNSAWWEIVGTNKDTSYEIPITGFAHHPGDKYYADVWLTEDSHSATAHFYMKDLDTGAVFSKSVPGIENEYISSITSTAEWIVERPIVDPKEYGWSSGEVVHTAVYPYLTNFGKVSFTNTLAGNALTGHLEHPSPFSKDTEYDIMYDPYGKMKLDRISFLDNSGDFQVTFRHTGHVIYAD